MRSILLCDARTAAVRLVINVKTAKSLGLTTGCGRGRTAYGPTRGRIAIIQRSCSDSPVTASQMDGDFGSERAIHPIIRSPRWRGRAAWESDDKIRAWSAV